jgi:ribulose-phosphate 3-epimerase
MPKLMRSPKIYIFNLHHTPMVPIAPAFIPTSLSDAKATIARLSFAHELHLDVVDGIFVKTASPSWPCQPVGNPAALTELLAPYTLEVDLMVVNPLEAAAAWLEAGADMFVFHIETITEKALARFASSHQVSIGVSAHASTPLANLLRYAEHADYVQLMGIETIGAQGQPFYEPVLDTIKGAKRDQPGTLVSVDGSVNEQTIVLLRAAGADRFVVGSAVSLAQSPVVAYQTLHSLVT